MRKGFNVISKTLSFLLALLLVIPTGSIPAIIVVNAAGDAVAVTDGELVAENYASLSDGEKALLSSGLMTGSTYYINEPGDSDNLVSVDADAKTVTASEYVSGEYIWRPVAARLIHGEEAEEIALTNGAGAFEYDGNVYSIEVDYQAEISVPAEAQEKLLNGASYLAKGIENIETLLENDGSYFFVASNTASLIRLTDGSLPLQTKLTNQDTIDAIVALDEQSKKNDGFLDIESMLYAYELASSRTEYLINHGAELRAKAIETDNYIRQIKEDNGVSLIVSFAVDNATGKKINIALNAINTLLQNTADVINDDWAILDTEKNPLKSGLTTDDYIALDGLVDAAIGAEHHDDAIVNPLKTDKVTVMANVNQFNVTVTMKASRIAETTVDSAETTELEDHTTVIQVLEGSTPAQVEEAVAASGIEDAALSSWVDIDGTNYDRTASDLPANLAEDTEYTITYSPKMINVAYGFETELPAAVPYGYNMTLPLNENAELVYDYEIDGRAYLQGDVYRVTKSVTVNRTEGKPWNVSRLNGIVADVYAEDLTDAEESALRAVALKGENVLFRIPTNDDGLVTVTANGGGNFTVTANDYPSGIPGVAWKAVSGRAVNDGETVAEFTFQNGIANDAADDFDKVEVRYEITLTNVDDQKVIDALNAPGELASQAADQKANMEILNSLYSKFAKLDQKTLNQIQVGVNGSEMSDEAKAAARAILDGCVDKGAAQLYLYGFLTEYRKSGLTYYYQDSNYARIRNQVAILNENLLTIYNDAEFLPLLTDIGYEDRYTEIGDIVEVLSEIVLTDPDERIDTSSPSLPALVNALEAIGENGREFNSSDRDLTLAATLTGAAPERSVVTLTVVVKNSAGTIISSATDAMTLSSVDPVTDEKAEELASKIQELAVKAKVDEAHYSTEDVVTIKAGDVVTSDTTITITYAPNSYTASLTDEEGNPIKDENGNEIEFEFNFDTRKITLPACREQGMNYSYVVDGEEIIVGTEDVVIEFTEDQINRGAYRNITRTTVNIARKDFLDLIKAMNEGIASAGMLDGDKLTFALVPMENEDGETVLVFRISPKNMSKAEKALQNVVEALTGTSFTHIKLGEDYLWEDGKISLQAALNAVLNSGMSLDTLIAAINKDGSLNRMDPIPGMTVIGTEPDGKTIKVGASSRINDTDVIGAYLMESDMAFGFSANDEGKKVKLYITLEDFGKADDQLKTARKLADKARGYGNVTAHDGMIDAEVRLPDKAYQAFLLGMVGLDYATLDTLDDPDLVRAAKFLLDTADVIVSDKTITTDTFENTAAKAKKTVDLSEYAKYYKKARGGAKTVLDSLTLSNEVSDHGTYTADANLGLTDIIAKAGVPESLSGVIKEKDNGVNASVKIKITNTPDYKAIIADPDAKLQNKVNFVRNLPLALTKIHDKSAVILLDDFDGSITTNKKIVLDLNGHRISGDLTANATTIVIDSKLDYKSGAGIDGTVSGKATLTAGRYGSDVSAFLKDGYKLDGDTVRNSYYYLKETEEGVEIHITPDLGEVKEADKKTAVAIAIEIAADIALNYYSAASLKVGGNNIYSVSYDDVVALLDGVTEENVNAILSFIDCAGVTALANDVIDKLVDFTAVSGAIKAGEAVAEYDAEMSPWTFEVEHKTDGDYLTVNVKADEDEERVKTQKVSVFVDDAEGLSDLLAEMGKVVTVDAEVELESLTYADKTVTAKGNGYVDVEIDVRDYPEYAIAAAVAIADATTNGATKEALVAGITEYYETGKTAALKEAFDKVSTAEIVKALSSTKKFDKAVADLGLTEVVDEDVTELYATYENVIKAGRLINNKITKFNGGDKKLSSLEKEYGIYSAQVTDRNETKSVGARGYNAEADVTATRVSLTVKAFREEVPYKILVEAENGDELYKGDDLNAALEAAQDNSTVNVLEPVTLANDAEIGRKITIIGAGNIDFDGHTLTLADKNAKITSDGDVTDSVKSGSEWSEVKHDSTDGHVYTLKPYDPEIKDPTAGADAALKGAKIDTENKLIIIDVVDPASITNNRLAGYGITVDKFNTVVDFEAIHASEKTVKLLINGSEAASGALVPTGAKVVVTATNPDSSVTATVTYTVVALGDVNCNGRVDAGDAGLMMAHFFGNTTLDGYRLMAADVNQNGRIESGDASKNQVKFNRPRDYRTSLSD